MRRIDREINNIREIFAIIEGCPACRLAMVDEDNLPYIVPMNFGFVADQQGLTFYFHSAASGRKLEILHEHPAVAIELDIQGEFQPGEEPCTSGFTYMSVVAGGEAQFIHDPAEKRYALSCILNHLTEEQEWKFNDFWLDSVSVFKVVATSLSAKKCAQE